MPELPNPTVATTTDAVSALAQSPGGGGNGASGSGHNGESPLGDLLRQACVDEGNKYTVGLGVRRAAGGRPYERKPGDPLYRPLRIYTQDPGARSADGATAIVNVPFEPLTHDEKDGLTGYVFRVAPVFKNPADEGNKETTSHPLSDPLILLTSGRTPSPVEPFFHQQMVYAVASLVYASFRRALGRHVAWGFDSGDPERTRLVLDPHGSRHTRGANYSRRDGKVVFGFFKATEPEGRSVKHGNVFSCVSHDIVVHEVTHALLDGLRAHFLEPTSREVLGFHEGFADLIAHLHRLSYREVVLAAVRRTQGRILQSELITSFAREFGFANGNDGPLRAVTPAPVAPQTAQEKMVELLTVIAQKVGQNGGKGSGKEEETKEEEKKEEPSGPHKVGQKLVDAVFDAFHTIFASKTERYMRLASGGTGHLPPGEIPPDLQAVLAEEASQLASQFLNVCIRALDYCPPVDLQFGDFLRAVITADLDLVPDDPWGYREAWIDAFARHGLGPENVESMSEDQLRWPPMDVPRDKETGRAPLVIEGLSFTNLHFEGDPARAASADELHRRACVLGSFVAERPGDFRLVRKGKLSNGDEVGLPQVQSVRTSRRVGPDGQVVFDLVAEVTQNRYVQEGKFVLRGGSTIILGPGGEVRYVIPKSVIEKGRVRRQRDFMNSEEGKSHVNPASEEWREPDAGTLNVVHQQRGWGEVPPRPRPEDDDDDVFVVEVPAVEGAPANATAAAPAAAETPAANEKSKRRRART